ncbi:hypothetical protein ACROYT_G018962 [Oculina patagonica]
MASSSGTSLEQRRWLVVGIALQNVLTPRLRDKIQNEMTPFYQHMVRNFGLDKQTYAAYLKTIAPGTVKLNYRSINNNAAPGRKAPKYDYCVKDEVSLAKLFMQPFMAHFNAFDSSFHTSAALAVLCGAPPFTSAKPFAEDVRSKVRNEWAHCDFAAWTEVNYNNCFDLMKNLVTNLNFTSTDEVRILGEFELWRTQGLEIYLGQPVNDTLLRLIQNEVQTVSDSLDDYEEKTDEKIKNLCDIFHSFGTEFERAMEQVIKRLEKVENQQEEFKEQQEELKEEINKKDKEQKENQEQMNKRLQKVETTCKTLTKSVSPAVYSRPVVFDAPDQNRWFTGREKEKEFLEKCLPFESGHGVKIAAICGLGGCGKTTLAAQFAWKRKPEYEGGVFWISMEDDEKFKNSINDLALRLGLMEDSNKFELTLSKVLTYISQQKKPCLMVTDNVDQLTLSDGMHNVLSGRWKRRAICHLLLTTRRETNEVCERIDLEPSCCLELSSFSEDEATIFLVTRIGVDYATEQEEILNQLAGELGCLPLALEQAGAHIKALRCSIIDYLKEYKIQRLKLLSQHPASPSWEYECQSRLSVHTTWLINLEYIKKSTYGEFAFRFLQVAAFLSPDEIPEDIIDCKLLLAECLQRQRTELPLLADHIVELSTKFSLLQRKNKRSLGMHRLVQDFIRENLTTEETMATLRLAFGMFKRYFTRFFSRSNVTNDSEGLSPDRMKSNRLFLNSLSKSAVVLKEHIYKIEGMRRLPFFSLRPEFLELVQLEITILEEKLNWLNRKHEQTCRMLKCLR